MHRIKKLILSKLYSPAVLYLVPRDTGHTRDWEPPPTPGLDTKEINAGKPKNY